MKHQLFLLNNPYVNIDSLDGKIYTSSLNQDLTQKHFLFLLTVSIFLISWFGFRQIQYSESIKQNTHILRTDTDKKDDSIIYITNERETMQSILFNLLCDISLAVLISFFCSITLILGLMFHDIPI
jgi:hypothetical protein